MSADVTAAIEGLRAELAVALDRTARALAAADRTAHDAVSGRAVAPEPAAASAPDRGGPERDETDGYPRASWLV